jgi:transcriptional regulator with XRE-family HTH domain
MGRTFSSTLAELRRRNGYSQRKVAGDLGISQALLSHYENGAREPGLNFVCRACDYYGVTADYILCRAEDPLGRDSTADAARAFLNELKILTNKAEAALEELK